MQSSSTQSYRSFLLDEFEARKLRNPSYSLRSYARSLGVAAPKLSQVLRGLCGLSQQAAIRLADRLALEGEDRQHFLTLVASEHERSKIGKLRAREKLAQLAGQSFGSVDLERFQIVSDWYFFAILELSETNDFQSSPQWIASRLGLTLECTQVALEILIDHGWLIRDEKTDRLTQTQLHIATPSGIPSRYIRKHHLQILNKAQESLALDVSQRDLASLTFSIDPSRMDEAKKALREFRRNFSKEFGSGSSKERVYCLSLQFFPLDIAADTKLPLANKKESSHES